MSDKRYLVPDGMVKAAHIAVGAERPWGNITVPETRAILEGASAWLDGRLIEMRNSDPASDYDSAIEDVRRMFLAPEPEVPDAVKALICLGDEALPSRKVYNERILEAYRRGKAGK